MVNIMEGQEHTLNYRNPEKREPWFFFPSSRTFVVLVLAVLAFGLFFMEPGPWIQVANIDSLKEQLGANAPGRRAAYFPDSRKVIVSLVSGDIGIYDANNGSTLEMMTIPDGADLFKLGLSPDGSRLFTLLWQTWANKYGATLDLWDMSSKKSIFRFHDDELHHIVSALFSHDSRRLLFTGIGGSGNDGAVLVDAKSGQRLATLARAQGNQCLSDTSVIAFTGDDHPVTCQIELNIYDAEKLNPIYTRSFRSEDTWCIRVCPDGKRLVGMKYTGIGGDYDLAEWDLTTQAPPRVIVPIVRQWGESFSPDGNYLSTVDDPPLCNHVNVWSTTTGELLGSRTICPNQGNRSFFLGDSTRFIAHGTEAETAAIYDAKTCALLATLSREADYLGDVVESPDGNHLATLGIDGHVRLWRKVGLESVFGPLASIQGLLLLTSLSVLCWSLVNDARRADAYRRCSGTEFKLVVFPLAVIGTVGVYDLLVSLAMGTPDWTVFPIYLFVALGVAFGTRFWRIMTFSILLMSTAWIIFIAYRCWATVARTSSEIHVLDRSYFLPREGYTLLLGFWALLVIIAATRIFPRAIHPGKN